MIRDLLIMQHGHAKASDEYDEFDCELRDKGKRNAQRMGVWLESNQLVPDHIVCSPALHVKTTAEKTIKVAGLNAQDIQLEKRLYNAVASDVIDIIKASPEQAKCLLLVGHNASLESALSQLCNKAIPKTKKEKVLLPATLVHLRIDCPWSKLSENCAKLIKIVYSKNLPLLFPFPDINGIEKRVRPAYYYTQSSVIPYRKKNGRPEILIISSSSGKHWVVPKGIHDPGMTAQASAAKEAFEEAGIEGHIAESKVGCYQYEKWEGVCTVSVFAMKVTRIIDEDEWEECHRQRRWVKLEDAVKLVHNDDLAKVIANLPKHLERVTA